MSRPSFLRVIDPGTSFPSGVRTGAQAPRGVRLFPDEGEYVRAVTTLAVRGPGGPADASVPDEVFLHLYAYELLERMREIAGAGGTPGAGGRVTVVFPFWPACLFEAAGIATHGALEIQALFPGAERTVLVERGPVVVAREASRVLGALRFDGETYCTVVRRTAERLGWEVAAAADREE